MIKRNPFYTVSVTVPATLALTYTIVKNFPVWRDIYVSFGEEEEIAGVKGIESVKSLSPWIGKTSDYPVFEECEKSLRKEVLNGMTYGSRPLAQKKISRCHHDIYK